MSDLSHLSNKDRPQNLRTMRPLGSWERQELERAPGQPGTAVTVKPATIKAKPRVRKTMSNHDRDAVTRPAQPAAGGPGPETAAGPVPENQAAGQKAESLVAIRTARVTRPCGLCGRKSRTHLVAGLPCCGTCETVRRNAKLRPDLLLAQVAELHPELLMAPEPEAAAPPVSPASCELDEARTVLAASNVDLVRQLHEMEEENEGLRYDREHLRAEGRRLEKLVITMQNEIDTVRENNQAQANPAVPSSLAAANIRLVQKLREMEAEKTALQNTNQRQWQEIHELQDLRNQPGPSQELLALQGELAGLQDVLTAWEQERAALLLEQARLTDQVRWLYEQLAATERKADGLEKEIDRLMNIGAPAVEPETAAERHLLIDADDDQGYRSVLADALTDTHLAISDVCDGLRTMLIDKNRAYGNSALEPLRVFSKASPQEQILVRIDDKLSRLSRGTEFPGDDTVMDLAGYLVLLMVQRGQDPDRSMEEAA